MKPSREEKDVSPLAAKEALEQMIGEAADKYEEEFHKQYPEGMTVADYCNREVPSICFIAGAESMLPLIEELQAKLSEQEELLHTMTNERLNCEMPLIRERDNLQRQNDLLRGFIEKECLSFIEGFNDDAVPVEAILTMRAKEAITQADAIAKSFKDNG